MNKIIEQYIFELTERITRFYLHLDAIREEFYINSDQRVTDKISFLTSYEQCLEKVLLALAQQVRILRVNTVTSTLENELLKINIRLSEHLNHLHENQLSHLPRPSEPVELYRFSRIIEKQVILLNADESSNSKISIYVSEKTGEQTYASDPLSEFKKFEINSYLEDVNRLIDTTKQGEILTIFSDEDEKQSLTANSSIHITIPRIDASNPCHWPILVHEVAHHMMGGVLYNLSIFKTYDIEEDFNNYLVTIDTNIDDLKIKCTDSDNYIILKSWLTECWCDLLACISMGYSYWFAQFSTFLGQPAFTHSPEYPPALFRLWLIQRFLKHRFSADISNRWEELTTTCEDLLFAHNQQKNYDWLAINNLRRLMECFSLYFSNHFFDQQAKASFMPGPVSEGLLNVLRYTKDIKIDRVESLLEKLQEGLPIPSVQISNENFYSERPTSVQEILCAASIHRHTTLKDQVIEKLSGLHENNESSVSIKNQYKNSIEKIIKRFDQSILRSIQVSEWFDLFNVSEKGYHISNLSAMSSSIHGSVLIDKQIVSQLLEKKLHIIPLFSLQQQLGSASIDIRLGTSFQLFSPNEFGVIDFASQIPESTNNRSRKKDLDFPQSIVIMPNQFILGHSIEYLKLPDDLTARLEGRSSFARLGIQIHMTAGFVDPGFEGVLTFEIFNAGHSPVRLYPGLRIGQLVFSPVDTPLRTYRTKHTAKYKGLMEHHYSLQGNDYEIYELQSFFKRLKK